MRFQPHFTLVISGSSRSGKSRLVLHLLQNADKCLSVLPTHIVISYGCDQAFYNEFRKLGIPLILHKGFLDKDPPRGSLVIFDDLQSSANNIVDYFIKKVII